MAVKALPERMELLKRFAYDRDSGELAWLPTGDATWSARYAGKLAGTVTRGGYRYVRMDDTAFMAHRLIWKMVTGEDPDEVDHINGDRLDNRLANLRSVSKVGNRRNKATQRNNRTGLPGVRFRRGKWVAEIKFGGSIRHLGQFDDQEHAKVARKAAERLLGFHPNHGRPAGPMGVE